MPHDLKDHLRKPPQVSSSTILKHLQLAKASYLICSQPWKMGNQLALLHTFIAQLHSSCKILESILVLSCIGHSDKFLFLSTNLQGGIELPNDNLVLVLPELQDFHPTHGLEKTNQAIHVHVDLMTRPA